MLFAVLSTTPVSTYEWGCDTLTTVKWNPVETSTLASTANDRSICLYDIRTDTPVRKLILKVREPG
jgi:DDB1- and CUL4-associated factor 13